LVWRLFKLLEEKGELEEAFSVLVSKDYLKGKFDGLGICYVVDTTTIPAKKGVKRWGGLTDTKGLRAPK